MSAKWFKCCATLLALLILSSLLGCSQSPVRNPFAGRQEPKLGALPALEEKENAKIAKVAWSSSALSKQHRFTKLQPLVSKSIIYAADHSGKVIALEPNSGKKLWHSSTGKKYIAGPALMGKTLLLTTSDAKVVALEASSGHLLWEKKVSSEVLATPSGAQNIVIVHAIDGSVTALAGATGDELWRVDQSTPALTLRYSSAPIVVGNSVLVGFATGKLLAFNLHSGIIEWERAISLPRGRSELQRMVDISADPIVIGNSVYAITYQGKLAGVDITSGDLLWERDISSYQNMASDNDYLYVTDNEHQLWAIDRHTGATMWKQAALATRYITGPAVVDNLVIVGDRGGYLHFLAANNGRLVNRLHVSGKVYQGPLSIGNKLVVSTHNGKLAVVKCSAGSA